MPCTVFAHPKLLLLAHFNANVLELEGLATMSHPDGSLFICHSNKSAIGQRTARVVLNKHSAPRPIRPQDPSCRFHSTAMHDLVGIFEIVVHEPDVERSVARGQHIVPCKMLSLEVGSATVRKSQVRVSCRRGVVRR